MTLEDAIAADRREELVSAAAGYEEALAGGQASLEVLLNLAVLYWDATDPGMAAGLKLSRSFLATAGERYLELLAEALRRFPMSTEARFWSRYIRWLDLDEPFSEDVCRDLLREDPTTLISAMHLFSGEPGSVAETEALELFRQCQEDGTTRARYVVSVLHGPLRRAGRIERSRESPFILSSQRPNGASLEATDLGRHRSDQAPCSDEHEGGTTGVSLLSQSGRKQRSIQGVRARDWVARLAGRIRQWIFD